MEEDGTNNDILVEERTKKTFKVVGRSMEWERLVCGQEKN